MHKLQKQVIKPIAIDAIADLVSKAKTRNQLITIADTPTGGWATVREYDTSSIADNSEDDKKINVTCEFFEFFDNMWGPHTIDRFANSGNTNVRKFNSRYWNPSSESADALTHYWGFDNNWFVPPIYSVLRTTIHLLLCKARETLIVPRWPSAPYWLFIFDNIWYIEITLLK